MRSTTLLFFLAFCSVVTAKTYYVAPTTATPAGNDGNAGTIEKPWATWGKAFTSTSVNAGDIVYFRGGVYLMTVKNGDGYTITRDGTINDTLKYWAYPGEEPILDCGAIITSTDLNHGIYAMGVNYVWFKGLTVRNVWGAEPNDECLGWRMGARNTILENCKVYNTHGFGFRSESSSNTYFINCDTWNNCDSLRTQYPGNDGYGFASWNTGNKTGSTYFKNCRAWLCGDDGFVFYDRSYVECDGCWSFNNGMLKGGGNGVKLGFLPDADDAQPGRKIINCIAAYNRAGGFTTNDNNVASINGEINNNTSYHNGYHPGWTNPVYGIFVYNTSSSNEDELKRVLRNNISYADKNGAIYLGTGALYNHSHNSWDIPLTLTAADFVSLDSTGISGQRQADGSLPDLKGFLKLAPTSKAIDAGVNVGLPFKNSAPDLGAFEYDPQPAANKYPSVVITSPSGGSKFTAPAAFTITANASDADGTVSKVEFFNGTIKLGEKTSAPWSFTWNNVTEGTYSLTAVATDNLNAKATSLPVSITVNSSTPVTNQPPVINLSSPVTGSTFTGPVNISITANASDADGLVSKVEFFNGTVKLGEKTAAPWSFTWNNVPGGSYSLTAVATDNSSAKTTSSAVLITVIIPPVITIISPVAGSTFTAPANITITANASDADGTISKVEFFNGANKLGEKTSAPWTFVWNSVPAGTHSLTAVATDNTNAKTTSSAVPITVNNLPPVINQPPVISITDPVTGSTFETPVNITIGTNASDADGTIIKVEFFNGANKLGEKTSAPWTFVWNSLPAGTLSLTAAATDNLNAKTVSPVVTITVNDLPPVINQPPVVSIVNPSKGQKFKKYANIIMDAVVSDPDGTISNVEFYNGNNKLAEITAPPYSFTWKYVDQGNYSITAVATDNLNASTYSSPVWLEVEAESSADVASDNFNLYPNPNDGHFSVVLLQPLQDIKHEIRIVTLDGRSIYKESFLREEIIKQFDLSYIRPGTYILTLLNVTGIINAKKFIKY